MKLGLKTTMRTFLFLSLGLCSTAAWANHSSHETLSDKIEHAEEATQEVVAEFEEQAKEVAENTLEAAKEAIDKL